MRRITQFFGACLLGGLMAAAVVSGVRPHVQAAERAAPQAPAGTELLQNPGFEDATGGIPDYWEKWGGTLEQTPANVHSGSYAGVLTTTTANGLKYVNQVVTVTGGANYQFSGWVLENDLNLSEAFLRVRWYTSTEGSGSAISSNDSTATLVTDDPSYRSLTTGIMQAPAIANSARACFYVRVATGAAGVAYFDDASFQQAGASFTANVRLYALAPANYAGSRESAAIINLESHTVSLDSWRLNDDPGAGGVSFPASASIGPGEILWLAQDADGFYSVWGFDADWAAQAITRPVDTLSGTWPGFTDAGEAAYLFDASSSLVDALAYGTGSASQGWAGSAVPYKYTGHSDGQVLYRKLDQATSLPVTDTDTAADWAQDPDDPINGRKLRYPGWDLEDLFFPAEIAATANVTLAVAPEGTLAVVSQTIASAQHTLRIEAYTLESIPLYQVISDRIQAGVVVTILLESQPPGGVEDVGKWIAQRLHNPPASSVYFVNGTAERYSYQHAKFILVDDRLALVSTDNLGENSMPSDPIANGTLGHRGFVAVTDSPGVITRLAEIFRRDCDPAHHLDVVPYDDPYAPPGGFTPLPPPDWTTYTARFTAPLATTVSQITVLHAPENALRDQDGLLGLLGRADSGDRIVVMQLNEPFTWTTGAGWAGLNPRLQALVAASRQGAEIRVLLDEYYDDPLAANSNTATCLALNQIAAQEGLSLICRLANVTGLGIHAKVFLASVDGERWVHLGSINGTETSNKRNREVALQLRSAQAHDWMLTVFDHDWDLGHRPLVHRILLPMVMRDYAPADYPLITEVFINPSEQDETAYEWVEIYNPGPGVSIAGWKLGDAINVGDFGDGRYSFPAGAQLARGQVMVVAACATNFSAAYGFNPDYEWTDCSPEVTNLEPGGSWEGFGLALGNEADEVLVQDTGDALVDSTAWGGTSRAGVIPFTDFETAFPSDASLKRHPPNTDHDDCSRDFYVSYSPSPGVVAGN